MIRINKGMITAIAAVILLYSCGNPGSYISVAEKNDLEKVIQGEDGTIALEIDKAVFYSSDFDPSSNTAEWSVIVSKPGRYNVWLSSATTDTMDLHFTNSVKINLLDERLEARPVGDRIIVDSKGVRHPWYRADSYMGSFYIDEAGEYTLQMISEKVVSESKERSMQQAQNNTRIMSVILTPMAR